MSFCVLMLHDRGADLRLRNPLWGGYRPADPAGQGSGYIGSTITSLIYASFTILLFAIEASIMSTALMLLFDIPIGIAHLISALVVIPIALYGISLISRFQMITQPVWLVLQLLPLAYIAWQNPANVAGWTQFCRCPRAAAAGHLGLAAVCCCGFGAAVAAAANRRAGRLPALPAGPQARQRARLVDCRDRHRPGPGC